MLLLILPIVLVILAIGGGFGFAGESCRGPAVALAVLLALPALVLTGAVTL